MKGDVSPALHSSKSGGGRLVPHSSIIAFTLIELLVVIVIISILAALLMPSLKRSRDLARSIQCMNNLRQIGISMMAYLQDYNGNFPWYWDGNAPQSDCQWHQKLINGHYSPSIDPFFCPSQDGTYIKINAIYWGYISYGMNIGLKFDYDAAGFPLNGANIANLQHPAATILALDSWIVIAPGTPFTGYGRYYAYPYFYTVVGVEGGIAWPRHNGICNVLWCDGHVSGVRAASSDPASIYDAGALGGCWSR